VAILSLSLVPVSGTCLTVSETGLTASETAHGSVCCLRTGLTAACFSARTAPSGEAPVSPICLSAHLYV
jgi:hypothetical protein